ncbi:MAG: hypothetical protein Roseis2KO_53830 [Roseivirga sp.]
MDFDKDQFSNLLYPTFRINEIHSTNGVRLEIEETTEDGEVRNFEAECSSVIPFEDKLGKLGAKYLRIFGSYDVKRPLTKSEIIEITNIKKSMSDICRNLTTRLFEKVDQGLINRLFNSRNKVVRVVGKEFKVPYEFLGTRLTGKNINKRLLGIRHVIIRKYLDSNTNQTQRPKELLYFQSANLNTKKFQGELSSIFNGDTIKVFKRNKDGYLPEQVNQALHKNEGFIHFACHLNSVTSNDQVSNYSEQFLEIDGEAFGLDSLEFKNKLDGKFVFLNSCLSGSLVRAHSDHFTRSFAKKNVASLISSNVSIPMDIAPKFSDEFYKHLFNGADTTMKGNAASSKLMATRSLLEKEHGDLGGLFYSLYGNPKINITV